MVLLWVLCFVALSSTIDGEVPDDDVKIVYGPDDRLDYYDRVNQFGENDAFARIGRESIVALMESVGRPNANGVYLSDLRGNSLGLCPGERFRDQVTAAYCSGTLVSENQVITAGHCITSQSACRRMKFVFNFYVTGYRNGEAQYQEIRDSDIYSCSSVVTRNSDGHDWAVATLDRAVPPSSGHFPIPFLSSENRALTRGQELVMIGFPSGLPMKIEDGGTVINPNSGHLKHFSATTDAFRKNSGSGVFTKDFENPVMIGILVRGQTDYIDRGDCREVNQVCDGGQCGTEGVSYVFHAAEHVNRDDPSTLQCGSSVSGSTVGRSSQVGYRSGEVTYEFTAESSTSVTFDLCDSEYDTFLRIFDDSGDEIARNDDHRGRCGSSRNRLASHVETTVQAGRTYTVVVEGFRSAEGNFQLDVTCGNDGGDQVDTIACGQTVSGTTVGRPSIVGNRAGDAIFEFVATQRSYEFDACLSTYDSLIRVYEGAAADLNRSSRQIAGNDDHGGRCSGSNPFASHIRRVRTRIGRTYTLVVEGFNTREGNFVVTANC